METMEKPIIYAPVYIPNTPDCEYNLGEQKLSKEKIRYLSKTFLRYKNIDLQHDYGKRIKAGKLPIQRGNLLDSFITKKEIKLKGLDGKYRTYPSGTWVVKIEITDPLAMKLYYQGELTGVSATANERKHADLIELYVSRKNSNKSATAPKRILLSDIKDPVVFTISLVKKPCVYGAKFCKKSCILTNKKNLEENTMSLKDIIKEKFNAVIDDVDLEKALAESHKSEEEVEETPSEETPQEGEETPQEGEETPREGEETPQEGEEAPQEGEVEEEALSGSTKSYVTREEVSDLFKAGFESVRTDLETLIDTNITESITALQQSQKEALGYITPDEAKEIFETEFASFKTDFEQSLKERQEESIQQFSKTIENQINPTPSPKHEEPVGKLFEGRDAYGCKIR